MKLWDYIKNNWLLTLIFVAGVFIYGGYTNRDDKSSTALNAVLIVAYAILCLAIYFSKPKKQ